MTKDEIKAYAKELIEIADIPDREHAELRTRIVQQVAAVCGMPMTDAEAHELEIRRGAGPRPVPTGRLN